MEHRCFEVLFLSFLSFSESKASSLSFWRQVVPLAAPHLPFQPHSVVQGQALPTWTWPCFIALAAVARARCSRRPTDRLTSEVEQLPILPGAELSEAEGRLVRLEGHVTLEAAALTAPFSEKKCAPGRVKGEA